MDTFDVIVIGGGPAGENAAGRCAEHGRSVVLVERELVGGECSYWACIPSKTLLRPGEVLAAARRVPGAREAVTGGPDVAAVLARRDWMTSSWDDAGQARWLDSVGATLVRGHGRLAGDRRVDVAAPDGSTRELQATQAVVLATGSRAAPPPVDGLSSIRAWDSRAATSARAVPDRLIVLGGGVVAVEMAQAFRRLGAREVTVVERGPRLLARLEPFAGEELAAAFTAEGIAVHLGVGAQRVERANRDGAVTLTLADGTAIMGDELLVATGRRPATDDVGIETVGLEPGRAVAVDDHLVATGVAGGWLYAIGDVNGRSLLTHMGKYQARIAADVLSGRDVSVTRGQSAVPAVVFTDPQVASVGRTEAAARDAGLAVHALSVPLSSVAAADTHGEDVDGTAKLVVDDERDVLVGATFTGPDVAELLHSATVAIVTEAPLALLAHAVPSFPTLSEVWLRLLEQAEVA